MFKAIALKKEILTQNRWWIYQRERFPVIKYGFLIAIFTGSAISYPRLLEETTINFQLSWGVAFVVTFGFFLQMRIADEFKDYEDDCRYRPERAVPRGLVSRRELGLLGIGTAGIQLIITALFNPNLLLFLALVWLYFALMCCEFFVRDWLKTHLAIYMLSHMVILPLITLYCLACSKGGVNIEFLSLIAFCLTCFFNGMVIEIGRKIYAPKDERFGVETYSAKWQPKRAVLIWWSAMLTTAIAAIISAIQINFVMQLSSLLGIFLILGIIVTFRFRKKLDRASAKWIDRMASIWIIVLYFGLGLFPLLIQG